jgi:hypothetical protein
MGNKSLQAAYHVAVSHLLLIGAGYNSYTNMQVAMERVITIIFNDTIYYVVLQ